VSIKRRFSRRNELRGLLNERLLKQTFFEQTRRQVFIPAPHAAEFGVGAAPKQWGTHHTHDFAQQLLLAAQASGDLGHEVIRQPQGIESLLESFGGVLRLAAITCEALVHFQATTFAGFDRFFDVSCARGHGCSPALLGAILGDVYPNAGDTYPPRVCDHGVTTASRARRTSGFLLSPICGIKAPARFAHSHTVCCTPHGPREGGQ
jgi:hypothetical protein